MMMGRYFSKEQNECDDDDAYVDCKADRTVKYFTKSLQISLCPAFQAHSLPNGSSSLISDHYS